MSGFAIIISGETDSIDEIVFSLNEISNQLQKGYKGGVSGELKWDLEEL